MNKQMDSWIILHWKNKKPWLAFYMDVNKENGTTLTSGLSLKAYHQPSLLMHFSQGCGPVPKLGALLCPL